MAAVRHLGFVKFQFFNGVVKRPILHQRTKFRKDQSNLCGYIAIFAIFNMTAAAILNFNKKFEILTSFPLLGANTHHLAKFHQNWSSGCRHIAI